MEIAGAYLLFSSLGIIVFTIGYSLGLATRRRNTATLHASYNSLKNSYDVVRAAYEKAHKVAQTFLEKEKQRHG